MLECHTTNRRQVADGASASFSQCCCVLNACWCTLQGVPEEEVDAEALELLRRVALPAEMALRPAHTYSGGWDPQTHVLSDCHTFVRTNVQPQRHWKPQPASVLLAVHLTADAIVRRSCLRRNKRKLSLAIALAGRPAAVLLDEPSSGRRSCACGKIVDVAGRHIGSASMRCLELPQHVEEGDRLAMARAARGNLLNCLASAPCRHGPRGAAGGVERHPVHT